MSGIIGEKELIFPRIINCHSCNQGNTYLLKVKLYGHNRYRQSTLEGVGLCQHREKKTRQVGRKEVERFLKVEKQEAEKFFSQSSDERRTNIQQFISDVNTVLFSLQRL